MTGYERHATTTRPGSLVPTVISVGPRCPAGTGTRDSADIQPLLVWITRTAICRPREYATTARPLVSIPTPTIDSSSMPTACTVLIAPNDPPAGRVTIWISSERPWTM